MRIAAAINLMMTADQKWRRKKKKLDYQQVGKNFRGYFVGYEEEDS